MVEVAAGPSDSATHEKVSSGPSPPGRNLPGSPAEVGSVSSQLPMVLKVPRLNSSPLALCDRPFSLLGFGDVLVPGASIASVAVWRLWFGLTAALLPSQACWWFTATDLTS